jgi:hypothetical protein
MVMVSNKPVKFLLAASASFLLGIYVAVGVTAAATAAGSKE